jgi:hypothetical protein
MLRGSVIRASCLQVPAIERDDSASAEASPNVVNAQLRCLVSLIVAELWLDAAGAFTRAIVATPIVPGWFKSAIAPAWRG